MYTRERDVHILHMYIYIYIYILYTCVYIYIYEDRPSARRGPHAIRSHGQRLRRALAPQILFYTILYDTLRYSTIYHSIASDSLAAPTSRRYAMYSSYMFACYVLDSGFVPSTLSIDSSKMPHANYPHPASEPRPRSRSVAWGGHGSGREKSD